MRPLTDQSFEIVAGARRYRAAQMSHPTGSAEPLSVGTHGIAGCQ
ncbi:MAG: hypothetical protein ABSD67_12640 [Terracidiphilus sp.]